MIKRILVVMILVASGFAAGLVLTGRMRTGDEATAAPPAAAPPAAAGQVRTAAAALLNAAREQDPGARPTTRTLTASLQVDYLKPTPLGIELEVRGRVKELKERKVVIEEWIVANGVITVRGEVVAVRVPTP